MVTNLERTHVICTLYFPDQLRSKSPLNWKSLSSSLSSLSSNSAEMSGSTGLHKSNSINNEHRTATNGPVLSGYSYIDHCGMTQPLQTLPPYLLNHFGLRPQLSVVREDSQEQEVEMESTRSLDEIQSASAVSDRPAVSDLKVDGDSNFEVMSVLSSTHLLSCSDDSPVTMV